MHIVLIGLMASGKSSVAREIADRLDRHLVDVDDLIHEQTGMTVRELWERGGEAAYRPLERDAVLHVLAGDERDVLAAPAGAIMDPLVHEAFATADTYAVYLRAEVATLAGRVSSSGHRPLLGDDPAATLQQMSDDRSQTYEALADLVLDVEGESPTALAEAAVDAMGRRG